MVQAPILHGPKPRTPHTTSLIKPMKFPKGLSCELRPVAVAAAAVVVVVAVSGGVVLLVLSSGGNDLAAGKYHIPCCTMLDQNISMCPVLPSILH